MFSRSPYAALVFTSLFVLPIASSAAIVEKVAHPVWYNVPATGPVTPRLFDVMGRDVRTLVNDKVPAGRHHATWEGRDADGRQVLAGAYFYELNAAGQRASRCVVRLP